jgi:hypothetical protein
MHLLETYALATGSKIKKPFILKKYFPIPFEKYITIQNSSGMSGKCYDYFQEVIDFIFPILEKENYKIIQIGSKDDRPLAKTVNFLGQTSIHQTAFILDNSKLHIGNDSFAVHMASDFNIPLVALYSVSSPEIAGPFWKKSNQICLTPQNWRPSFNPNDNPKRINEIKIESIINSIFSLLNINNIEIETLNIGDRFLHKIIEASGEQILDRNVFNNQMLNIRLDYSDEIVDKEYSGMVNNLNIRPCTIITNKPFNLHPLIQVRHNLERLFYDVSTNLDLEFIKTLEILGLKYSLIFNKNGEEDNSLIQQRKFELIDLQETLQIINHKKININFTENTYYKSSKILFSKNKIYLSRAAQLEDLPISDINNTTQSFKDIKNKELFLKEDYLYSFIFNSK